MASDDGYCLKELCEDFKDALENDDNYDVIIRSGEDSSAVNLHAHSFILRARCPFFKLALTDNWKEKNADGKYTILKPNITPDIFRFILRYMYTGYIDYKQLNAEIILNTLLAADELGMGKLIDHLQNYLIANDKTMIDDPLTTLEIIYTITSLERLKECCLQQISTNPSLLFSTERFLLAEKPILQMILDRDDLKMEEADIWDSVLRWHFARYLNNDDNEDSMSLLDVRKVKDSIKEFIPVIRIYDISKADFYLRVYPYRNILPADLLDDVLRYHLLPNAVPKLNSRSSRNHFSSILIKNDHIYKLFQKWICRNDTVLNAYNFKIIFRGTKDGFYPKEFHDKCDNRGATLVVAKLKDSQKLLGGYNPLNWSSSGTFLSTSESFLFLLDPNQLGSAQIWRVSNMHHNRAVYDHGSYGPTFGGGHELGSRGGTTWTSNNNGQYNNISLPNSFIIEDYEVFKIEKVK